MADEEMEEEGSSGGGKKKFIIIILVILLLLGGAGAAYYFMFMESDKEESLSSSQTSDMDEMGDEDADSQEGPLKIKEPIFSEAVDYTVNLRDGKHFLKLSIIAVLEDQQAYQYMAQRMPLINDMVISTLHNKTADDFRERGGIELLKSELLKKANSIYTEEFKKEMEKYDAKPVKRILFKEFLVN